MSVSQTCSACTSCVGLVKPSIVFFADIMPTHFAELVNFNIVVCDLVR